MEENKKKPAQQESKYSYDELNKIASDLFQENRDLKKRVGMAEQALSDLQTQNLFAYISMLGKILDNAISFKPEFIDEVAEDMMMLKRNIGRMFLGGDENREEANGPEPAEAAEA